MDARRRMRVFIHIRDEDERILSRLYSFRGKEEKEEDKNIRKNYILRYRHLHNDVGDRRNGIQQIPL